MPVYGKNGRSFPYCGICGEEPAREDKRPWSLSVHCWKEHGLTFFPGCSLCGLDRIYARQRIGDVTGHITSHHRHKSSAKKYVVWLLVDIPDSNPFTYHPRPQDLAIMPGRDDQPGEDATKCWRERQPKRVCLGSGRGRGGVHLQGRSVLC